MSHPIQAWALTPRFHPYPGDKCLGGLLSVALSVLIKESFLLGSMVPFVAPTFLIEYSIQRDRMENIFKNFIGILF